MIRKYWVEWQSKDECYQMEIKADEVIAFSDMLSFKIEDRVVGQFPSWICWYEIIEKNTLNKD